LLRQTGNAPNQVSALKAQPVGAQPLLIYMMNSSAIGREDHGTLTKERRDCCIEHVEAAREGAE
jgi:hypothetical protein